MSQYATRKPWRGCVRFCLPVVCLVAGCAGGGGGFATVEAAPEPPPPPPPPAYDAASATVYIEPNVEMSAVDPDCPSYQAAVFAGGPFRDAMMTALLKAGFNVVADSSASADFALKLTGILRYCRQGGWVDLTMAVVASKGTGVLERLEQAPASAQPETALQVAATEITAGLLQSQRIARGLRAPGAAAAPGATSTPGAPASAGASAAVVRAALTLKADAKMLVLPLRPVAGVAQPTCALLTNYMLTQLDGVERLVTVGQDDIQAALGVDRQRQALGCDDFTCAAQIGGALGVDLVVFGEIGAMGSKYNVNLSAIRARDVSVAARASVVTDKSDDALLSAVPDLVNQLIVRLNR